MKMLELPQPLLDQKELRLLEELTTEYETFCKPSTMAKMGKKAGKLVPKKAKELGKNLGKKLTEQEIYQEMMRLISDSFQELEEEVARLTISEKDILKQIQKKNPDFSLDYLEELCFFRSYTLASAVRAVKTRNYSMALAEGAATGAAGFYGLPFNLVISNLLYFRSVQTIAMFYGYDVKENHSEMIIANHIFILGLSPMAEDSELNGVISKILSTSHLTILGKAAGKGWQEMAQRGGLPLLLTQLRALANKAAQKALEKAGAKGLENTVFKEALELIGKKLTLKSIQKSVPFVSGGISALIDFHQAKHVATLADIFYHKRFLYEKESRIRGILGDSEEILG